MSKDLELNFLLRVVDDDPRTLDAVTFMLKCEGYEVTPPIYRPQISSPTTCLPSRAVSSQILRWNP